MHLYNLAGIKFGEWKNLQNLIPENYYEFYFEITILHEILPKIANFAKFYPLKPVWKTNRKAHNVYYGSHQIVISLDWNFSSKIPRVNLCVAIER